MDPLQVGNTAVQFRPCANADRSFLLEVYASTRADELAQVPWSVEQREAFLRQQFEAQDHAYQSNYPGAAFYVVVVDGTPAGRLYLHPRAREIRIMDIALLPEFRNRGLGAAMLRAILQKANRSQCAVTIHVEAFNPARRVYERLGFVPVSTGPVYLLMEWQPTRPASELSQ